MIKVVVFEKPYQVHRSESTCFFSPSHFAENESEVVACYVKQDLAVPFICII